MVKSHQECLKESKKKFLDIFILGGIPRENLGGISEGILEKPMKKSLKESQLADSQENFLKESQGDYPIARMPGEIPRKFHEGTPIRIVGGIL